MKTVLPTTAITHNRKPGSVYQTRATTTGTLTTHKRLFDHLNYRGRGGGGAKKIPILTNNVET